MSQRLSIILGIVLVLFMGVFVYSTREPAVLPTPVSEVPNNTEVSNVPNTTKPASGTSTPSKTPTPVTKPTTTPSTPGGITIAQVEAHGTASSCWSVINGNVYDLTSWIPNHPGGRQRIINICGIDGSNDYNRQHGGSSRIASILGGFKIGTLIN